MCQFLFQLSNFSHFNSYYYGETLFLYGVVFRGRNQLAYLLSMYCIVFWMRGVVLFLKRLIRNYSQLVLLALSEVWLEGLNGVYRQPSKKPLIFYRQPSKSQSNINRQNVSGYFKSHYFDEILAPEESLHLKNHGPCCQKHPHSLFLSLWTLQDLTT